MKNVTPCIVLSAALVLGASLAPAQYIPPPPVLKLGQCVNTKISWLGSRLEEQDEQPVAGSGSAVQFANGLYQVSRQEMPAVNASQIGDPVSICLTEPLKNCRSKIYKTTNLRSRQSWILPDSDKCGG